MEKYCSQCGAPIEATSENCQYCGASTGYVPPKAQPQPQYTQQPQYAQQQYAQPAQQRNPAILNSWPIKNKLVAALLAILLDALGIHKFYLGQGGKGILYILFCWTYIPGILGLIEGIMILTSNDENFQLKYKCRLQ